MKTVSWVGDSTLIKADNSSTVLTGSDISIARFPENTFPVSVAILILGIPPTLVHLQANWLTSAQNHLRISCRDRWRFPCRLGSASQSRFQKTASKNQ